MWRFRCSSRRSSLNSLFPPESLLAWQLSSPQQVIPVISQLWLPLDRGFHFREVVWNCERLQFEIRWRTREELSRYIGSSQGMSGRSFVLLLKLEYGKNVDALFKKKLFQNAVLRVIVRSTWCTSHDSFPALNGVAYNSHGPSVFVRDFSQMSKRVKHSKTRMNMQALSSSFLSS